MFGINGKKAAEETRYRYPGERMAVDGNTAVILCEREASDAAGAYPITPSTQMGEYWAEQAANTVPATVAGQEYLGADMVLRCQVGSEQITVRAPGQQQATPGAAAALAWQPQDMHFFDAQGRRMA